MNLKSSTLTLLFALAIISAWYFFPFILKLLHTPSSNIQDTALLGDTYGILNTLFSGLALAAVAIALYLQINELRITTEQSKRASSIHDTNLFEQNLFYKLDLLRSAIADYYILSPHSQQRHNTQTNQTEVHQERYNSHRAFHALWETRFKQLPEDTPFHEIAQLMKPALGTYVSLIELIADTIEKHENSTDNHDDYWNTLFVILDPSQQEILHKYYAAQNISNLRPALKRLLQELIARKRKTPE